MQSQGLDCKPEEVANLKGDEARSRIHQPFKEVQRLKTQLDQYTDLSEEKQQKSKQLLPEDTSACLPGRVSGNRQAAQSTSRTKGMQTMPARYAATRF